jgi:hypothetical protein
MIELTEEMRNAVASALDDKFPMIATSVGEDGQPSLSFYGSTHVHSADQLAIWVRTPTAGLLGRIPSNPHMALLYRNPAAHLGWQFHGRARQIEDGDEATRVYNESPQVERDKDPDRLGRAVIIDVDRVLARGAVIMER